MADKEYRNIQEQVQKNKEDIERIGTGIKPEKWLYESELAAYVAAANLGKYYLVLKTSDNKDHLYYITKRNNDGLIAVDLGVYPAGTQGPQGDRGIQGIEGDRGTGVYGTSDNLPPLSGFNHGDFYLLNNGNLYKYVGEEWQLQCNIKGSKGNPGANVPVVANPATTTQNLNGIEINGIGYKVQDNSHAEFDEETEVCTYNEGLDVGKNGDVNVGRDLYVEDEIVIDGLGKIVDTDGEIIIPEPIEETEGLFLKSKGNGYCEWESAGGGGGGTQLYKHELGLFTIITTSSAPFNWDSVFSHYYANGGFILAVYYYNSNTGSDYFSNMTWDAGSHGHYGGTIYIQGFAYKTNATANQINGKTIPGELTDTVTEI